ncbi:hypothetical protein [Protaetiibacter mangrovi]|uniref:Ig-like domain-containing protein n=1 Tax=Protaetiibacter mangrovi TaxID=2970926 RepID=A0ABT1ZD26_9MICO|nr:hypothetical protein [Protaetiibacter mangrovi]MCS0498595.1 hypothetical protein [Protaetiibacter mangrovi]TPX03608.1 hypothetical protein FJ656_16275 [Schumannella luteola]
MTPRWLLPVVASGAAIVVGVTAAVVGAQFAAPETRAVAAPTVEVPVLAPVTSGLSLADTMAAAGDDGIPVSVETGTREVADAGATSPAIPDDLATLLDDLATADDPAEVPLSDDAGGIVGGGPAGDPCADGGADCPEGVPGTILPVDGDLPLSYSLYVDTRPTSSCPKATAPDAVQFTVFVSEPSTFTVTSSDGWHHPTATITTTDAQAERWADDGGPAIGGGTPVWIPNCVELDGFLSDTLVMMRAVGTTDDGRTKAFAFSQRTDDGLDIPPTRIVTVGASTVFVSAAHTRNEDVQILVQSSPDGTPACTYGEDAPGIRSIDGVRTEDVSDDYLAAHSYEPDYTKRTSASFIVPPGTNVIVCVGWFPKTDHRFFTRQHPTRVSELPLVSPSPSAPTVTVSAVEYTREVAARTARLSARTEDGTPCGLWNAGDAVGNVLCSFGTLLGWQDADGALVVRTEVDTASGTAANDVLLDIGLLSCDGGCAARERDYDVPLSTYIRPRGICSGDCPVDPGQIVGVVRLTASWPANDGAHPGWTFGDWYEGGNRVAHDPAPPLDITQEVRLGAVDTADRSQDATLSVVSDRPVSVSARLEDGFGGAACVRAGGSAVWESTFASATQTVVFPKLCTGSGFVLTLTLTDAAGGTSVYSWHRDGTRNWWPAQFQTASVPSPVVIDDLTISDGTDAAWWVESARVEVNYDDARLGLPAESQRCWVGGIHGLHSGYTTIALSERFPVRVRASLRPATAAPGVTTPDFPTHACTTDWDYRNRVSVELEGWISYDDYLVGSEVTLTDPDTGWTAVVRLSPEL